MSVLVIEQPNYLPWLGYFDLLDRADVWVWYDDVQYTRRDWRNRNRFAGSGEPIWLTIPVLSRGRRDRPICEIEIDYRQPWVRKHLATLRHFYGGAPFFATVLELVRGHLESAPTLLADLTIGLNEALCDYLGIASHFVRSSRLTGLEGSGEERIVAICRRLRPRAYLSGPAARDYLSPGSFTREQIELRYIAYRYDGYPRDGRPERTDLSIVDALFWIGPEATMELIRRNRSGGR